MGALIPMVAAFFCAAGPGSPVSAGSPLSAQEAAADWHDRGSLVTWRPIPAGENAMRVSGGFALALPFVGFEYGRGLGGNADVGFHYEGVVGLLHFFDVAARWAPIEAGTWRVGFGLAAIYSFFGLASDNTSLTSTLFLTPEVGASAFTGRASELMVAAGVELDLLEWVVLDGEEEVDAQLRVNALLVRFGWRTRLAEELDVYVLGRLRIPTETFDVDDEQFSFVPYAEFGGTWTF